MNHNNEEKKEAVALLLLLFIAAISILLVVPSPSSSKMIVYAQYGTVANKTNNNNNNTMAAHHNFTATPTSTTKGRAVNINNNIIIPGAVDPAICTPDLKRFVVHLFNETFHGKPILKILSPCVTVTGIVIGNHSHHIPHINPSDSDLIINLLPDPEFKSLVTPQNDRFGGAIHVEAICQGTNLNTKTGLGHDVPHLHVGDCKGFNGPHFPIPKVGDRLKITGVYAQDIFEGGHTEIHPVYKIEDIAGPTPHPTAPPPSPPTHKAPKIYCPICPANAESNK
jgi:hypothetical protein